MPEEVTDKEVEQARSRVDKLNEQIAAERAKLAANAVTNENAVRVAQLNTEEERLKAQLEALRLSNKAAVQREAVGSVVESVRAGSGEGQPSNIVPPPSDPAETAKEK